MSSKIQRINVSFPKKLLDELSSLVPPESEGVSSLRPPRRNSKERLKILEKTAGAWKDSSHPDLKTMRDVCNWVNHLRQSDEERLSKTVKHSVTNCKLCSSGYKI